MDTVRLSLVNEGEIVLVGERYQWSAFQVTKQGNDYTYGKWLFDDKATTLKRGLPTKSITKEWIKDQTVLVKAHIGQKQLVLKKLQELEKDESIK